MTAGCVYFTWTSGIVMGMLDACLIACQRRAQTEKLLKPEQKCHVKIVVMTTPDY